MNTRNFVALGIAGVLIFSGSAIARPVKAQTFDSIQAQIQQLLAKISDLTNQLQILKEQKGVSTPDNSIITGVGNALRHRVCNALFRSLSKGSSGDDVVRLQEFLRDEGFFSASATGYFGPITEKAVARWQSSQGVDSVGVVGPITRSRIKNWCGITGQVGDTACTKEYRPVCGEREVQCITAPCNPIEQTYSNRCMMTADGATFLYEGKCSANRPPVIASFSGPTLLAANETGTWTVEASDPESENLSYRVSWGDESVVTNLSASLISGSFVQTTTFTHTYSVSGKYTVKMTVRDAGGRESKTTMTVKVGDTAICDVQYVPVCGQPPKPACRYSSIACAMPELGPQTYGSTCLMNASGATLLYQGECSTAPVACTADAKLCSDGSYVGRTGPNCQFVCPSYY